MLCLCELLVCGECVTCVNQAGGKAGESRPALVPDQGMVINSSNIPMAAGVLDVQQPVGSQAMCGCSKAAGMCWVHAPQPQPQQPQASAGEGAVLLSMQSSANTIWCVMSKACPVSVVGL
jgi:hypothetical protein